MAGGNTITLSTTVRAVDLKSLVDGLERLAYRMRIEHESYKEIPVEASDANGRWLWSSVLAHVEGSKSTKLLGSRGALAFWAR